MAEKSTNIPRQKDGGYGWVVVFASFMVSFIGDGVIYTFGLFVIEIIDDFQASKGSVAWVASVMTGITYCSGPLAGILVNKYGCRVVSVIGSLIATVGFAISYFAPSVTFLYFSIGILGGTGLGLVYLPQVVIVTYYFEERRSLATGIAVCGSGVGTFVFAPLIEYMIRAFQWRGALLGMAAIIFQCVFFSLLYRPIPETVATTEDKYINFVTVTDCEGNNLVTNDANVDQVEGLDTACPKSHSSSKNSKHEIEDDDKQDFITSISVKTSRSASLGSSDTEQAIQGLRTAGSHSLLPVQNRGSSASLHHIRAASTDVRRLSLASHTYLPPRSGSIFAPGTNFPGILTSRKDLLCTGSVGSLSHQKRQQIAHTTSTTVDASNSLEPTKADGSPCTPAFYKILNVLLDFSIFKNPLFLLFTVSNFFTSIGYNSPYIYIVDMAIGDPTNPANDKITAGYLLSIIGITNTVSRVLFGYIGDKPWTNRLYLYVSSLIIAGIATCFCSYTTDFLLLSLYSAVFGITMGVYITLTSVILVDLIGLDKLTNAFGLLLLVVGTATVFGPPLVGSIVDEFGDYVYGFWLTGGVIALSGFMLFPIPYIQRRLEHVKKSAHPNGHMVATSDEPFLV